MLASTRFRFTAIVFLNFVQYSFVIAFNLPQGGAPILRKSSSHVLASVNGSTTSDVGVRVGIVGAGAIGFGTAAILNEAGHNPMIWSPSGAGTSELLASLSTGQDDTNSVDSVNSIIATNALEGTFTPRVATTAKSLVSDNDVVIIALPANGHKQVMDDLVPHVRQNQHIIISSHASLGAVYLAQQLQEKQGITVPITAWGTTLCTARRPSGKEVMVNTVRKVVDFCTVPRKEQNNALKLLKDLFGPKIEFRPRDGLLAISLSNLNPQNHLGIALGNMSRMEKNEQWYQSLHITPNIGRFLEDLDNERLEIAKVLGFDVKTIYEHFSLSFHVPITSSISDMNQQINVEGNDVYGPNTADSRYVTEDVPYGLPLTVVLGKLVDRPAVLHDCGIKVASSMYGRDFEAENELLKALELDKYSLEELKEASYTGLLQSSQVHSP